MARNLNELALPNNGSKSEAETSKPKEIRDCIAAGEEMEKTTTQKGKARQKRAIRG